DFDLHRVGVDGRHAGFVMHDHAGENHHRRHHDQLDHDERHRTPVYLPRGHRFDHLASDLVLVAILGGHGTQVEQGKTERRMHERRLHVHGHEDAEPDQVDAHLVGHRPQQRHDDERQLEEVQEEGQHERQDADDDQEAPLAARDAGKQVLDPQVAADAAEGQAEHGRANQDEHHEARQLGGGIHGLAQQVQRQAAADQGHDDGAHGTHRPSFGRRGHADEDGAQHQEDEKQWRDHHEGDALGQSRQHAQLEHPVDDGDHKSSQAPQQQAEHHLFVDRSVGLFEPLRQQIRGYGRNSHQYQQRAAAARAVGLAERARLFGQGRSRRRLDDGYQYDIQNVGAGQQEPRHHGGAIHVANGPAQL